MRDSATGRITYRTSDGDERTWDIHAHATRDTEATLRAHFAVHAKPGRVWHGCTFVRAEILPDRAASRDGEGT